jgi:hypothetical protein
MTIATLSGLGVATCPSAEQLAGITDLNDPCQFPGLLPSTESALPTIATTPTVSGGGVVVSGNSCPAGSTCTFFNDVPDTAVYTLGGIILAFIAYGVSGK